MTNPEEQLKIALEEYDLIGFRVSIEIDHRESRS
jgi:hypothetical protein